MLPPIIHASLPSDPPLTATERCECGCDKMYPRSEMVMKRTLQPEHPFEYVNRKHALRLYGSQLEMFKAGFN